MARMLVTQRTNALQQAIHTETKLKADKADEKEQRKEQREKKRNASDARRKEANDIRDSSMKSVTGRGGRNAPKKGALGSRDIASPASNIQSPITINSVDVSIQRTHRKWHASFLYRRN